MRANFLATLTVTFFACLSVASADKRQLAAQVFDSVVAPQVEPIVDRLLLALKRESNPPAEVVALYKQTMLEVLRHPEYRRAYVDAYQNLFSEQELLGILELAKSPAFQAFAREAGSLTQMTYPTYVRLNGEAKKKLEAQLTEKGLSDWK